MMPTSIFIVCKNLEERNQAIDVALKLGCQRYRNDEGFLNLSIHGDGYVLDSIRNRPLIPDQELMTFSEFMQKYSENEMIKKIHQAKKELDLNNSELSLKMGKSRPYIAKMLNQPQSEKVQNKVIAELDKLLNQPEVDDTFASNLANELESKDKEITDLKKIIESKDLAISGLIKQNDEAKKIHDKDVNALAEKDDQFMVLAESLEQSNRERDYFVNQYKQSEEDVNSLKSKIKRERIIILIVIAILTALFFLKGSIGG